MPFTITAIDLAKLEGSPESATIVRLMWGLNELNQYPQLASLLKNAEEESPHLWKYFEGLTAILTRLRAAKVSEVLHTVVRPIVSAEGPKAFPEINALIDSSPDLQKLKTELTKLFCGQSKPSFELHRQVRHRITDHFDHKISFEVLTESFEKTVTQAKSRSDDGIVRGWVIQGSKEDSKISRFLLVDDILTTAWRETILGVPYNPLGYSGCDKTKEAKEMMDQCMSLFHGFASHVVRDYLEKFDLFVDCEPDDLMTPPPIVPL